MPQLSDDERELLNTAAQSQSGDIKCVSTFGGVRLGAGDREFIEAHNPRSEARWLDAIRGLEDKGLIEPLSLERQIFRVTHTGYQIADS